MKERLSGLITGLALMTSVSSGCSGSARSREDALWRIYRASGAESSPPTDGIALFATHQALDRAVLVRAVLERNPSVDAAREALRAALVEIPQVTALDDPMVGYELAPLSVAGDAPLGQIVSLRQRVPFPGKRRLAGELALAMADAEAAELGVVQLELAQRASDLYDDYFVAARGFEINAQHQRLLEQIKKSAEAQYVVGRAAQQDPIQAEVELAQLERERITLEAERHLIVAQLNGLLHRAPTSALPPAPGELVLAPAPNGTVLELEALALRGRPRRERARAHVRAARAQRAIAKRAYYPDFELMASYDSMWDMPEHRWMVGVMLDVPIQLGRRRAAVAQAEAEIARAGFEDERLVDEIRVEVEVASRRIAEAEALVAVHTTKLLPAARAQVDSARAGFTAAQNSFLAVIQAQKSLRQIELSLAIARAELSRRKAALARVVGLVPGLPEGDVP